MPELKLHCNNLPYIFMVIYWQLWNKQVHNVFTVKYCNIIMLEQITHEPKQLIWPMKDTFKMKVKGLG